MTEFECLEHICTEGERWDTLAWRYYGDACAFGRILQANPSLDMDTVLASGTLVLVPLLDTNKPSSNMPSHSLMGSLIFNPFGNTAKVQAQSNTARSPYQEVVAQSWQKNVKRSSCPGQAGKSNTNPAHPLHQPSDVGCEHFGVSFAKTALAACPRYVFVHAISPLGKNRHSNPQVLVTPLPSGSPRPKRGFFAPKQWAQCVCSKAGGAAWYMLRTSRPPYARRKASGGLFELTKHQKEMVWTPPPARAHRLKDD